MRTRDTQHSLRLPRRRRSYSLRVHHEGSRQSHALLSCILRANDGKYRFYRVTREKSRRYILYYVHAFFLCFLLRRTRCRNSVTGPSDGGHLDFGSGFRGSLSDGIEGQARRPSDSVPIRQSTNIVHRLVVEVDGARQNVRLPRFRARPGRGSHHGSQFHTVRESQDEIAIEVHTQSESPFR